MTCPNKTEQPTDTRDSTCYHVEFVNGKMISSNKYFIFAYLQR